ncbi:MAG TPA: tol-pal system protein [Caulobacteraceae bacterium]|nr:tol-pal system protein [Caulobacteraceae bacterium]
MTRTRLIASACAAVFIAAIGGAVVAQTQAPPAIEWDKRRLERLERNVRKLENQLSRANRDPNAPPTIIEPDAEVVALQTRVDEMTQRLVDLEQTLQRVNGQLETSSYELDQARREGVAARNELEPLRARLGQMEERLARMEAAGVAAAAEAAADPQAEFDAAAKLAADGAHGEAIAAFEAFIEKFPDASQTPEAHYRLGEAYYNRDEPALAARAYSLSLAGWPKTRWAAEANLKLATSLANIGRNADACGAVAEFDKRYAPTSSANAKNRAAAIKTRAKCAA